MDEVTLVINVTTLINILGVVIGSNDRTAVSDNSSEVGNINVVKS